MAKKTKEGAAQIISDFSFDKLADYFGDDATVGRTNADIQAYIRTGCRQLDWAMADYKYRAGFPAGRMVEIFGPEAVGKTSFITHAMISAQRGEGILVDWIKDANGLTMPVPSNRKMKEGLAILIDSECKYPIDRAQRMGLDMSKLIRIVRDDGNSMPFEECIENIEKVLDKIANITYFSTADAPIVVCLDSLAQSPTEAELEGDGLQDGIAAKARKIRMAMRRMTQKLSKMCVYMLFTNHVYARIGAPGSEASGGRGLKLAASLRFNLREKYKGDIFTTGQKQIGITAQLQTIKSSVCIPPEPIDMPIIWATGISEDKEILDYLIAADTPVIKKTGGWVEVVMPTGEVKKKYEPDILTMMREDAALKEHLLIVYDSLMAKKSFS